MNLHLQMLTVSVILRPQILKNRGNDFSENWIKESGFQKNYFQEKKGVS